MNCSWRYSNLTPEFEHKTKLWAEYIGRECISSPELKEFTFLSDSPPNINPMFCASCIYCYGYPLPLVYKAMKAASLFRISELSRDQKKDSIDLEVCAEMIFWCYAEGVLLQDLEIQRNSTRFVEDLLKRQDLEKGVLVRLKAQHALFTCSGTKEPHVRTGIKAFKNDVTYQFIPFILKRDKRLFNRWLFHSLIKSKGTVNERALKVNAYPIEVFSTAYLAIVAMGIKYNILVEVNDPAIPYLAFPIGTSNRIN